MDYTVPPSIDGLKLNPGDLLTVNAGGVASNIRVVGGREVLNGGISQNTILSGGSFTGREDVHNGGESIQTVIYPGGVEYVYSGGVADHTTIGGAPGGGKMFVLNGGRSDHTTIVHGSENVSAGGVANDTIINDSSGTITVDGTSNRTLIHQSGMVVEGQGVANDTTLFDHSTLSLRGGKSTVNNVTFAGDHHNRMTLDSVTSPLQVKGTITDWHIGDFISFTKKLTSVTEDAAHTMVTVTFGNQQTATYHLVGQQANTEFKLEDHNNGVGTSLVLVSSNLIGESPPDSNGMNYVLPRDEGKVPQVLQSGDTLTVLNLGRSHNIVLNGSAQESVFQGGISFDTVINKNGVEQVFVGGLAEDTTINPGGLLAVNSQINTDIVAIGTTINGGVLRVSGGQATGTTINAGGTEDVFVGGFADDTTINPGGTMNVNASGVAARFFIEGGNVNVKSGGSAEFITIFSGSMDVSDGRVDHTTVESGGQLFVHGTSSKVTNTIIEGGSATAEDGAGIIGATIVSGTLSAIAPPNRGEGHVEQVTFAGPHGTLILVTPGVYTAEFGPSTITGFSVGDVIQSLVTIDKLTEDPTTHLVTLKYSNVEKTIIFQNLQPDTHFVLKPGSPGGTNIVLEPNAHANNPLNDPINQLEQQASLIGNGSVNDLINHLDQQASLLGIGHSLSDLFGLV